MGRNYSGLDVRDKIFTSLENFIEFVAAEGVKKKLSLTEMFQNKGLDDTLHIVHETKRAYHYGIHSENTAEHHLSWAQYKLTTLPGCCGVVVSHNSWIHEWFRGKGLGQWFHKQRLTLMKVLGYSCAICTVTSDNEAEKYILEKNGWECSWYFTNKRTGHEVEIWIKDL